MRFLRSASVAVCLFTSVPAILQAKKESTIQKALNEFDLQLKEKEDAKETAKRWEKWVQKSSKKSKMEIFNSWMSCARYLVTSGSDLSHVRKGIDHYAKMSSQYFTENEALQWVDVCAESLEQMHSDPRAHKISSYDVEQLLSYAKANYPNNLGLQKMLTAHFTQGDYCQIHVAQIRGVMVFDIGFTLNRGECISPLGTNYQIIHDDAVRIQLPNPTIAQPSGQLKWLTLRFFMPHHQSRYELDLEKALEAKTNGNQGGTLNYGSQSGVFQGPEQHDGIHVRTRYNFVHATSFSAGFANSGFDQMDVVKIRKSRRGTDLMGIVYGYLGLTNANFSPVDYKNPALKIEERRFLTANAI